MGVNFSREDAMKRAIEQQDINTVKTILEGLTTENASHLCQSLVSRNAHQCTLLHYATWQGTINE
jgi:hypothetical protein